MGELKNRILKEICEEYRSEKEGSFLYWYLRNVKCREECDRHPERADKIVRKRAGDLMYNMKKRSRSPLVDLVDAYLNRSGQAIGASSDDEIDVDLYQRVFEEMNKEKREEALIPIKADPVMGGGLYIIGRKHYKGTDFRYGDNYSCGIGIIGGWYTREKEVALGLYEEDKPPWGRNMPSVKEALAWYDNVYLKNSRFDQMRWWNGMRPEGVPEKLDVFFDNENEEDFLIVD